MATSLTFFAKMTDTENTKDTIEKLHRVNFVNVIAPLISSELIRELRNETLAANQTVFTRSPLIISAGYWNYHYSPYISSPNFDVADEEILENNIRKFKQDFRFAVHIKQEGYIVVKLMNQNPWKLGLLLKEVSDIYKSYATILIEIQLVDPIAFSSKHCRYSGHCATGKDQWKIWNQFHAATGFSSKFELSLVMGPKLPPYDEFKRWLGDGSIGMIVIPNSCFTINKSCSSILSPKHQQFVTKVLQYHQCIITIEIAEVDEIRLIQLRDYLNQTCRTNIIVNAFTKMENNLRLTLPPHHNYLDSTTCEAFEADPNKYKLYQDAIEAALIDKVPEDQILSKVLTVLIVGAGRGPLIRASVNASKLSGRQIKIILVEQNPHTIMIQAQLIEVMWPDQDIELISKDMRRLQLKEKADIIVSELLGSFGDNELSPECLDEAQMHLKPDGISIPYKSISYIQPIMSTKVFQLVRDKTSLNFSEALPLHINYFINFGRIFYIDHPKNCFTFVHPNKEKTIDNTRHASIKFVAKIDCLLDGFAGYFTAKLFKDIEISIHPDTFTPEMCSWYPIFFSAPNRIEIKKGDTIVFEIWRKTDGKVWFEWRTFLKDEWRTNDDVILNKNGASASIRL